MNLKKIMYTIPLAFLASCDSSSDSSDSGDLINCTTEVPYALTITILDKETGNSISCGATVQIEDTNFSETVTNSQSSTCDDDLSLSAASNRAGIYDIHVSKEGYLDWSEYNLEVTSDECGVSTVRVEVLLEK